MAGNTKFQARNREIHSDFDKIIKEIAFLNFSRYSSTGVSVYFTLTDFFFIAFQYVSAKFSERILSFSSLVKKFCQFFLTSEAFFPFSSLVKAFSHLK